MMNDTYVEVKTESELQWMIEMINIAKENRSPSRLNAFLLLIDICNFIWRKNEVDSRMQNLLTPDGSRSIFGWLWAIRFKFKKFHARELPGKDVISMEKELGLQLQQMEKLQAEDPRGFDSMMTRAESTVKSQNNKAKYMLAKHSSSIGKQMLRPLNWMEYLLQEYGGQLGWHGAEASAQDMQDLHKGRMKIKQMLLSLKNQKKQDAEVLRSHNLMLAWARDQHLQSQG